MTSGPKNSPALATLSSASLQMPTLRSSLRGLRSASGEYREGTQCHRRSTPDAKTIVSIIDNALKILNDEDDSGKADSSDD